MSDLTDLAPAPRSARGLLMDRTFGSFFAARLLTAIGTWLHSVVAAIAVYALTRSALAVAVVSVVQFAPQLVLAPISGKWADRGNVKTQMMLGRGMSLVGSAAATVWFVVDPEVSDTMSAVAVTVASLIVGVGLVVGGPAMQSAVPLLVRRDELPAAMALNTAPITIGRIAGPALGALATAGFGYGLAFGVATTCHLMFIGLTARTHFPMIPERQATDTYSVRAALAFVRTDRPTMLVLVGVTALGLGSEPTVTLAPPLGHALGGGPGTVGALTSFMGIGAALGVLVSSALAGRIRHDRVAGTGMVLMALGMGACAVPTTTTWPSLAAFAVSGLGFIMSVSSLSTLMQIRLPPLMRGRVMALWLMGFVGSRPLGATIVGSLADWSSVHVAFAAVSALMVVAAIVCRPSNLSGAAGREEQAPEVDVDLAPVTTPE